MLNILLILSTLSAAVIPIAWMITFSKRRSKVESYGFYFFLLVSIVFLAVFVDFNQILVLSLFLNIFYPFCLIGCLILFFYFLYSISYNHSDLPKSFYLLLLVPVFQFLLSAYAFYIHTPLNELKIYYYDVVFAGGAVIPESVQFLFAVSQMTSIIFAVGLLLLIVASFFFVPRIIGIADQKEPHERNKRLNLFLYVISALVIFGVGTILQIVVTFYSTSDQWLIISSLFWGIGWLVIGYFMHRIISIERVSVLKEFSEPESNLMQLIYQYFEREKPYLNPELTLEKLSKDLNSNRTYISKIFKEEMNTNFNNFINDYRVSYAKSLFASQKEMKMNEVAQQSGFNSYSTFFRVFKEQTGVSPQNFLDQ